jgi:hypothetical protein
MEQTHEVTTAELNSKRKYETPSLVVFGDLRELTQTSGFRTNYDSPLRRFRTS